MESALKKLQKQYMSATGISRIDENSKDFLNDFSAWIKERQYIGEQYSCFLNYMNLSPDFSGNTIEVGKSVYDSIAINSLISMVTPSSEVFEKRYGLLYRGNFIVGFNKPIVLLGNPNNFSILFLEEEGFNRYITQNPYITFDINNWEHLHNSGKNNITVGVYGFRRDKDIKTKIDKLRAFKEKLDSKNLSSEYGTDREFYYFAIASNREEIEKTKIKYR